MDKQAWLSGADVPEDAERKARNQARGQRNAHSVANCIHCGRPFGITEGYVGAEVSLCDRCNGD